MGPTPILEMARAYGLRPRLWLLSWPNIISKKIKQRWQGEGGNEEFYVDVNELFDFIGKVKSAYEPSGPSGRSLSRFP